MTRIGVKLDDVESGFEVFPDASYRVRIQPTSKIKTAKGSGEGKITFISKCTEGDMEGKMISWDCSLQEQALWNLRDLLEKIEVEWESDGFELDDTFDKEVIIDVTTYHWKDDPPNVMRNQVNAYHAV